MNTMELIYKDKLLEAIDEIPCGECDGPGLDECYACVVGRVRAAPAVDVMCGLPANEAMAVLHHYKNTGERLTEQYVKGYVDGFNECDRQYKEVFDKMAPPEGAESVQISMNRLSLGNKTSDNDEVQE